MSGGYSIRRHLLSAVLLVFFSFFVCSPAISEESAHSAGKPTTSHTEAHDLGEEGDHETDRSADLLDLLYRFINFTLLVIILVIVIKKARLTDYLSLRSEDIRKKLEDMKREKEDAEKRYRDMEDRVRDFEAKRSDLLEEYKKEGVAERDRIIDEAREKAKQIIAQSETILEQEILSVRNRLKQEIVEMAMEQAKELIQKEINQKDHENMIDEFIERVRRIN